MKLPLSWLKTFVTVRTSPEKLAQLLTLSGSEVEKVITGPALQGVVVGLVEHTEQHPNADRLKVCKVRVQVGEENRTIVCGAPNVAAGQKVPVALPGTKLPNGIELKDATIRGVESHGMICAADELGLGEDHSGILVLDAKAPIGDDAAKWLGSAETILDLDITPNRGDCLSIRGLAREVAVLTNQKLKVSAPKLVEGKLKNTTKVKILDAKGCSQYVTRVVEGLTVKASPSWVQDRLRAVGVRPINAVVDAANYVMFEIGQPLHTFDADKVGQIIVRSAKSNERLVTLDGQTRTLQSADLVIADNKQPIALAGVMGGQATEVTERTTRVLIESANFDPIRVRLTAQRLGLRSEASSRFEKGIDSALAMEAADRCAAYIAEWGDGVVAKGRTVSGKKVVVPKAITLPVVEVERLLGVRVPVSKIKSLLVALGCRVTATKIVLRITPPTWRLDLKIPADLVEEIGRLLDYNTFTPSLPVMRQQVQALPSNVQLASSMRQRLVAAGLTEISTYSFYSQDLAERFALDDQQHLAVENPFNPDQALMRRSLMPQVLQVAGEQSANREQLGIFELGRVFWPTGNAKALPEEQQMLAIVRVTSTGPPATPGGDAWRAGDPFIQLKGIVEDLLHALHVQDVRFHASTSTSARLTIGNESVGIIGLVGDRFAKAVKLRRPAAFCELDCSLLTSLPRTHAKVKPLSVYPSVERDLAYAFPEPVAHAELVRVIRGVDPLILNVRGIDRFKLPDGKVSVTLRITFQSPGKTLTGEVVQAIVERLTHTLGEVFHAELR
ncbi:MAG: phenylalanine--tRNA ligase subunit beta [Patescibacteria group bacterium]